MRVRVINFDKRAIDNAISNRNLRKRYAVQPKTFGQKTRDFLAWLSDTLAGV